MKNTKVSNSKVVSRAYTNFDDFLSIRQFLIVNWRRHPAGYTWEPRRLDGAYFHREQVGFGKSWKNGEEIRIWEVNDRGIVAVVHPEGEGDAWIQIHPDYHFLEPEIVDWAEANMSVDAKNGHQKISVFVWEYDKNRQALLEGRGYRKTEIGESIQRFLDMDRPVQPSSIPEGYRIHKLMPGDPKDCERYALLLNAAFRCDFHNSQEIINFTMQSPSFNPELELIAADDMGAFIALAGMTYDEVNHFGWFEPVCAHPGSKPVGLTGKLMIEGIRRVQEMGAKECYVSTGIGMAANRFYKAVGFEILHSGWFWTRSLD